MEHRQDAGRAATDRFGQGAAPVPDRPIRASVVIAARDAERFLGGAVLSALEQTLAEIEVIVVDDGSTDATGEVARRFANTDDRVRSLRHDTSQGVSTARNRAIGIARGDWIAVLDADDAFAPDRLRRLVEHAERERLDLLADNLELRDFSTSALLGEAFPRAWMTTPLLLEQLLRRDWPGTGHKMLGFMKPIVRRTFLARTGVRYAPDAWCGEDFLFYVECLLAGAAFGLTPEAGYLYAQRPGSASGSRPEVHREVARINGRLAERVRRDAPALVRLVARRQAALDYLAFSQSRKARRYGLALDSLRRVPLRFLAGMALAAAARLAGGRRAPMAPPPVLPNAP